MPEPSSAPLDAPRPVSGWRRWGRRLARTVLALVALALLAALAVVAVYRSQFGAVPAGERLARIERSPNVRDGRFTGVLSSALSAPMHEVMLRSLRAPSTGRTPAAPIPVVRPDLPATPSDSLRATWLGHSAVVIDLDGQRFLTDPALGPYASPGRLFGVERFFPSPLPVEAMPVLDAVVFSHDHYDHLDAGTVRALAPRARRFVVPLGLGAHLEAWGVPPGKITELDWWEEARVGPVRLVATPARHSSGRFLNDRNRTLWAGWAFVGTRERVFFSGDTGLAPHFAEVGQRLGPFDLTLVEIGSYNRLWANIHLGPEQALAAHRLVRGRTLLPVHWATFNLAPHGWTEPVERLRAALAPGERVAFPRPGETVAPQGSLPDAVWWPSQPWQTAAADPIVSSDVPDSLLRAAPFVEGR